MKRPAVPGTLAALLGAARLHAVVAFRPRRLALPLLLAGMAIAGAILARALGDDPLQASDGIARWVILFGFPAFCGLVLGGGAWGLEVEGRTLTYLLLRPVARAVLYAGKLCAVMTLVAVLGVAAMVATYLIIHLGGPHWAAGMSLLARGALAAALAACAYTCILGVAGVAFGSKAFSAGALYLIVVELAIGGSELGLNVVAVAHHLRVVAGLVPPDSGASPVVSTLVILGVCAIFLTAGMLLARVREHRMKSAT